MSVDYEEIQLRYNNSAKEAPIVIIDSGVGGLNITRKFIDEKVCENVIFFVDHEFLPFGNKDPRILSRRIINIITRVKKLQPKMVILACNTIDAIVGDKISGQLGNIPFIRIIEPTSMEAVKNSNTKQIALLATINTVTSQKYMMDMLGYAANTHLYGIECANLVSAIESNDNIKTVVKEEIQAIEELKVDTIILGCTHFSSVIPIIKKQYKDHIIIDSSEVVLKQAFKHLETKLDYAVANKGEVMIITTALDDELQNNITKIMGEKEYKILLDEF